MDPFTAIGAGISAAGSIYTNQQNLQFAQQQASGAFLPQYVAAEKAAGINPYSAGSGPTGSFRADNPLEGFARLRGITPEVQKDPIDQQIRQAELEGKRLINDKLGFELARAKLEARGASAPAGTARVHQAVNQAFGYPPTKDAPFPYNLIGPGMSGLLGGIDEGAGFLQRHLPSAVTDWLSRHNMD